MKHLSIDVETFSSVDLTKAGVYRYSETSDFEVLLFGYSTDCGTVRVVDLASGGKLPTEIQEALLDNSVTKWAFNAQFERVCLSRYLGQWLHPGSWRCTMVWSAYLGLPLSLEGAALVTGAEKQKLTEGKELIRYFCKPCKPTASNGGRTRNLPEHASEKWNQFKAYNVRDVETEMAIQARLEKYPVPEDEWRSYILDQQINDRGVILDMTMVRNAIAADELRFARSPVITTASHGSVNTSSAIPIGRVCEKTVSAIPGMHCTARMTMYLFMPAPPSCNPHRASS